MLTEDWGVLGFDQDAPVWEVHFCAFYEEGCISQWSCRHKPPSEEALLKLIESEEALAEFDGELSLEVYYDSRSAQMLSVRPSSDVLAYDVLERRNLPTGYYLVVVTC